MENEKVEAAKEIAKATGKVADLAEKTGAFLKEIIGSASIELGGIALDWASYWRYKNLLTLRDRVQRIHELRKLNGKPIPISPRYAVPLVQAASLEDDDDLGMMWSGLVANATDPNKRFVPKKIFIDVLRSLEPLDLKILQFLSRQGWLQFRDTPQGGFSVAKLTKELVSGSDEIKLSLQNLHRLGCIVDEYEGKIDQMMTTSIGRTIADPKVSFRPSPLAFALIRACETDPVDTQQSSP